MATASRQSTSEVSKVFDCSICLEKLKIPKYLPCLHTFCESCIQSYIESTAAYTDQTQPSEFGINCPVCRSTVTCTDKGTTINNWAKRLPINHLIMSLKDSIIQGGENKTKMCTCCERKGESMPATLWCNQCSDALCVSCSTSHNTFKPLMNHEILPLDMMKSDLMEPDIDEPCPFHRGKYFEVYCLDHRKLCCSVCFATQHRTCSHVLSIDEVSQRDGVQSSAEMMVENLSKIAEIVDKAIKEKNDNIQALDSDQQTELSDIASAIDDIKHILDTLYQSLETKLKLTHDEQRSNQLAICEHLKGFKRMISNDSMLLKAVITQGNAKQIFLTLENLRHQITCQFSRIASYLETDKELRLKYTRNKAFQSISGIKNLIDIDVISTDTRYHGEISDAIKELDRECLNCFSDNEKNEPCDPMLLDDPFSWGVKRTLVINTKLIEESESEISGGTFLSDGKLVLTDRKNNKLKVYDSFGSLYTQHRMTSQPYDVTRSTEAQMFYVTHCGNTVNSRRVSLCKLTDNINIVSTFQAPDGVSGISYAGDVLVLGSESQVYIISSKNGTIMNKVYAGIRGSMNYVEASQKSDRLVTADGNCIVCRTLKTKEICRYKDKRISETRGIAFDLQNNIYVCEWNSKQIFQLKQDGSKGKILPINLLSITTPYSIGFHLDGRSFFVGDLGSGCIEVHTLMSMAT